MQTEATQGWQCLAGKVAPAVLCAPKTNWDGVHSRIVAYLVSNVADQPWANHLALVAAVLTARKLDVRTVHGVLSAVHSRLRALFPALGLQRMEQWQPEEHVPAYLKGELLPAHTQGQRAEFWKRYACASKPLGYWLETLPHAERPIYEPWVLPTVHPSRVWGLTKGQEVRQAQRDTRKAETDAVVPQFAAIRTEAHFRYNRMVRLRQAYHDALARLEAGGQLPYPFSYEEGADPERGIPAQEQLHFRIWDRRSFVLAHAEQYHAQTLNSVRQGRAAFTAERNGYCLEFVGAKRLVDDSPATSLWFADILQTGVLGDAAVCGEHVADKQRWLRAWGYGEEETAADVRPFASEMAGLLSWPNVDSRFMSLAQERAEGVLIPVEPLYAATALGLLAVDTFTTTGMRMNEAMQIRLTKDCFVRLVIPAPPEAKDQTARVRWAFRLIPKGERQDIPQDYFIGEETKRLLVKVARMLAEHYALQAGESLPAVPFDPTHGRSHRFGSAPYLFQYNRRHLSDQAITACMRFLLHGLLFRTKTGAPVVLKAHLLRHAFATHAVQVEKIPVDIVGAWLKQKNLDVTDYYSKPTASMVGAAADQFLARVAAHVQVGEAVRRSPAELRRAFEEARGKAGTLAQVTGGHCVSHGFCAAKFACVGCAGKVPEPTFRGQVERHKEWALMQVNFALQEGLLPEAERMRQLMRDCDAELQEMSQIEAFRQDEERVATIRVDTGKPANSIVAGKGLRTQEGTHA
jgi:hypothetical protein